MSCMLCDYHKYVFRGVCYIRIMFITIREPSKSILSSHTPTTRESATVLP